MSLYTDIRNGLRNLSDVPTLIGVPLQKLYETIFGPSVTYASDYSSFAAAVTAIGSTPGVLRVNSKQIVSTAVSVPSTLRVEVVDQGQFVKATGGSIVFNGEFVAPIATVFSGFSSGNITGLKMPYPQWFGAAFDGVTNDSTAWACAIASTSSGPIIFPAGTSKIATGITFPANKWLMGSGIRTSILTFSGSSGFAITLGNPSATEYVYGCGARDFTIVQTVTGGNGIMLAGTGLAFLESLYLEGNDTGRAIDIDGVTPGTIFTRMHNVDVNHWKYGCRIGSTGAGTSTTVKLDSCYFLCDVVANSIGLEVVAGSGNGSQIIGGNFESCVTGIKIAGFGVAIVGARFEANTTDINLISTARQVSVSDCFALDTIVDGASDVSNSFMGNTPSSGSHQTRNIIEQLSIGGGFTRGDALYVRAPNADNPTFSLANAAAPSTLWDTIISNAGDYTLDCAGVATVFSVNPANGQMTINKPIINTGVAFAALGTPVNGTFTYCSDCTIANPCDSGGNGAFAKRLNGVWVCN